MQLTLKYFASVREAIGLASEPCETTASTVAQLRDELIARGAPYAAALARGRAVRVALNQRMADESAPLMNGAELAFFPPVTGG